MAKYSIIGGNKLKGEVTLSGAKNVAFKALIAGFLTKEKVLIKNIPLIGDFFLTSEMLLGLGAEITIDTKKHEATITAENINLSHLPLEMGAKSRAAAMLFGPLLARTGKAIIPNPGGCKLGARPIDRHIEGLEKMGAIIKYEKDGFFHASLMNKKLKGTKYVFDKNTHTGTETLIMAGVLATGETILENAAEEPEVDDLINLLNKMGAKIKRVNNRTIIIEGVNELHGAEYEVMPDRNEAVTYAVAALATGGEITIKNCQPQYLKSFLSFLSISNFEILDPVSSFQLPNSSTVVKFKSKEKILPQSIVTGPHPGFMTDWQGPMAVLLTQAKGTSIIHETIYENRFGYVSELVKMGAHIENFQPEIKNPENYYNFNWECREKEMGQAIKIYGGNKLHSANVKIKDLRAGASLVLAALTASGKSELDGIDQIERGYEDLDKKLNLLGAKITKND